MLASLGVVKTVAEVNREITTTLTSDYEMEKRTIVYREDVTRAEIKLIRQRHFRLSKRARTWARLYIRMGLLEVVVQVEAGTEATVSQEVEVTQQARAARVAVAVTPQPPHKTPPLLSTE